jgi:hypothetical protein
METAEGGGDIQDRIAVIIRQNKILSKIKVCGFIRLDLWQ